MTWLTILGCIAVGAAIGLIGAFIESRWGGR